ncbi:hypothetical protein [Sphingobacterium faecale]|uniref:Uncharacterized protein n=1 Tax=Sphingobacterium faecale TaxID=2803775 RepID=A0ABS1R160_9SPHI|nr:hypothetical protein [Sphingobacterium faecale]MBL1408425.1 hypothetical protein [Sphingobacterium faecale]
MHHVEYENNYITLLTKQEILNPYLVLDNLFVDFSSAEALQDELFEILTIAIRRNYWLTYDSPLVLYKKYKKLVRLFEAGWLISKIRPTSFVHESLLTPYDQIEASVPNRKTKKTTKDVVSEGYRIVVFSYNSSSLDIIRGNLFYLLFEGLMPTCVKYSNEIDPYYFRMMQEMNDLISALQTVYHYEKDNILSELDMAVLKTICDEFISRESFFDYNSDLQGGLSYTNKEELKNALAISRKILFTTNFWKLHGNPGNILYYYHDFLFILDSYWMHYLELCNKGVAFNTKWKYPGEKKNELHHSGYEWIKRPWKLLYDNFEKRSIHDWRNLLDKCLEDVLSNRFIGYSTDSHNEDILRFISSLLFLESLQEYEPEIY